MTETTGGRGSGGFRRPSHEQPHAPTPEEYEAATRHHRLDGEEWDPPLRLIPGAHPPPIEEADPRDVERYASGAWMRANVTTLKKFRHGWLCIDDGTLVFKHHRLEGEPELEWPGSTIIEFHVTERDPTPRVLPTGVAGAVPIGYYDAWQVDIVNNEGVLRMFVLWDPAAVEALRQAFGSDDDQR